MQPRPHRPLTGAGPVVLRQPTDPRWLPHALEHFDLVLIDHAHCEKKAAANALSLLQSYPEIPELPMMMARLAREESAHLAKVLELMAARGLTLSRDGGDPYAQQLQSLVRTPRDDRRLDRLLVAAIIEARSCERLALLAEGLEDERLRRFYRELAQSEDGHQSLFYRLAVNSLAPSADAASVVDARLDLMLEREAEIVSSLELRAAIH